MIKTINPDLVQSQGIDVGIPAFLAKKLLGKQYIIWARNSREYWYVRIPLTSSNRIQTYILKLILTNADRVIALTDTMKYELKEVCDREIITISNGLDLDRFENFKDIQISSSKDIITILWVGGFRPEKGVQYLIESMNNIIKINKNARLLLIGYGNEEHHLKKLVHTLNLTEYICFIGKVPNEEIPKYMCSADVFVLPSISEGFPVVLLEAMAAGLPIVTTTLGGLAEIIKDGENGFLVHPQNSQEIAEKVLLVINSMNLRAIMAKNNKDKVKLYSWDQVISKLEYIYTSMMSK